MSKTQSSRWQALAAIPEPVFEAHVEEAIAKHRELSPIRATGSPRATLFPTLKLAPPRRLPASVRLEIGDALALLTP